MSYVIDAATKIHDRQLEAITKGRGGVVKLVKRVAELAEGAPQAPAQVRSLLAPVTSVVGAPTNYVRFVAESSKQQTAALLAFQDEIVAALAHVDASEPAAQAAGSAKA